ESNLPGEVVVNTSRVFVRDPVDPEDFSRLTLEGRSQVRELAAFLAARIPGFSKARLLASGEEIGIRNSRQVEGEYRLTDEDILLSRPMPDAIAHSAYPIDMHSSTGGGTDSRFLPEGRYYDIPYRCLIPRLSRNLLVAGRCASATFAAQASIRLSPSAGAMGQAAGLAASIAAGRGLPVAEVDPGELRDALRAQGAWLPPRP
ncbi:MAG TPA: FAD-dependent oxidoreductase, partial [Spirochaetia bacterium]|nr:FAD-dependent oxidoreductase [Spirochaetia bacterium]